MQILVTNVMSQMLEPYQGLLIKMMAQLKGITINFTLNAINVDIYG